MAFVVLEGLAGWHLAAHERDHAHRDGALVVKSPSHGHDHDHAQPANRSRRTTTSEPAFDLPTDRHDADGIAHRAYTLLGSPPYDGPAATTALPSFLLTFELETRTDRERERSTRARGPPAGRA